MRYLSISRTGTLCFSWNGDLYTMKEGQEPVKLQISVDKDRNEKEHIWRRADQPGALAVAPGGKEIAVVSRGDVYVTTLDLSDTRRITETPGQERNVSFGKDGKVLYYDSERDGEWGVYRTVLKGKKDKYFTFSYDTEEERISPKGETCFQPLASPDGKKVAYLRNRTEIVVADADGSHPRTLLKGQSAVTQIASKLSNIAECAICFGIPTVTRPTHGVRTADGYSPPIRAAAACTTRTWPS